MIDGRPAATSLSPKMHLADVQGEGYCRSLHVHHPTFINHNYLSGSHHIHSSAQGICDRRW
uniref:Uncharacterized protein n=1 Tax=Oryctolagus cuniculus TaxID=9986 RepID=A0A5F9D8Z4_RABIT